MEKKYVCTDDIVLCYDGLARISPYDMAGIAKYFVDQFKQLPAAKVRDDTPVEMNMLIVPEQSDFGRARGYRSIKHLCPSCGAELIIEAWNAVRCFGKKTVLSDNADPIYCPYCGTKIQERGHKSMKPIRYTYGMRLRGFSPGCQPMTGFVERRNDPQRKYHDLLVYDRELTEKELQDYELDFVQAEIK